MDPRTRRELMAENEALYAELEDIYERLSELLDEAGSGDEEVKGDDDLDAA